MSFWPMPVGRMLPDAQHDTAMPAAGPTVAADASANVKGAWVEIIASTAFDSACIVVSATGLNVLSTSTGTLLDIGIGAAGSETVVIPNILVSGAAGPLGVMLVFPLFVPSGTRIAARVQSEVASNSGGVDITLYGNESDAFGDGMTIPQIGFYTAYGISTATSAGTTVSSPGTVDTFSSWVELTASTSKEHRSLAVGLGTPHGWTGINSEQFLIELGMGASGSEVVVSRQFWAETSASENIWTYEGVSSLPQQLIRTIPSGSRLVTRIMSSKTNKPLDIAVYGGN